jgi:ferredoxin
MTRLHIDWTRCDGHGACSELLPEILVPDEWGFPVSTSGDREPEIPKALESRANHAQKTCPLMALRLV